MPEPEGPREIKPYVTADEKFALDRDFRPRPDKIDESSDDKADDPKDSAAQESAAR